jgi:hypothetical protein
MNMTLALKLELHKNKELGAGLKVAGKLIINIR